jgi:hypothetical protein
MVTSITYLARSISAEAVRNIRAKISQQAFLRYEIKVTAVNDALSQSTSYPPMSHSHPSGQSIATLVGTITNHSQNITAGVANSKDSNSTVRLDGMASCCKLQREKIVLNNNWLVVRVCWRVI